MKILVIRFSSLGDVVLGTVIFPNLKAFWPQAEVSVLTKKEFAGVFDGNPHVNHVWIFDPEKQTFSALAKELREQGFDVVFDLHGNPRSFYIRLLTGARRVIKVKKNSLERRFLVWLKAPSKKLKKSVRERILDCLAPLEIPQVNGETQLYPQNPERILTVFSLSPDQILLGLAPGAKHATKRWPVEKFAEVANLLGKKPNVVTVLLGSQGDQLVSQKLLAQLTVPFRDLTGWTSIPELIAVTSRLSLLVTNDSGILHIGEALKIPTVAIFGPTVKEFGFSPYRSESRLIEADGLKCRPCSLHGTEICPLNHFHCMADIQPEAVVKAGLEVAPVFK